MITHAVRRTLGKGYSCNARPVSVNDQPITQINFIWSDSLNLLAFLQEITLFFLINRIFTRKTCFCLTLRVIVQTFSNILIYRIRTTFPLYTESNTFWVLSLFTDCLWDRGRGRRQGLRSFPGLGSLAKLWRKKQKLEEQKGK